MPALDSARRTSYRGIMMRSRLEARYAAWLDQLRCDWAYEPNAFAGPAGQYLPDFRLADVWLPKPSRPVYVEVKPQWPPPAGVYDRMEVIWESEPEAVLAIETDREGPYGYSVTTLLREDRGNYYLTRWIEGPEEKAFLAPSVARGWAYEKENG